MTTNEASIYFKRQLAGIMDTGEASAVWRLVMKDLMNYEPVDLILRGDNTLPEFMPARLDNIITRLRANEPVQYILGKATFHGHEFAVSPATLIPRPETEQLVDMIVDENTASDLQVLDIGTGSGCIAVSLAMALKFASVTAIDISSQALEVAKRNAESIKARVKFIHADALCLKSLPCEPLDIIVSNPPYVCNAEKSEMEANVLDYEPHSALFVTDGDPLVFYRAITLYAARALKDGGKVYFEINRRYGSETAALLKQNGFTEVRIIRDSFNNDRFVAAVK